MISLTCHLFLGMHSVLYLISSMLDRCLRSLDHNGFHCFLSRSGCHYYYPHSFHSFLSRAGYHCSCYHLNYSGYHYILSRSGCHWYYPHGFHSFLSHAGCHCFGHDDFPGFLSCHGIRMHYPHGYHYILSWLLSVLVLYDLAGEDGLLLHHYNQLVSSCVACVPIVRGRTSFC